MMLPEMDCRGGDKRGAWTRNCASADGEHHSGTGNRRNARREGVGVGVQPRMKVESVWNGR